MNLPTNITSSLRWSHRASRTQIPPCLPASRDNLQDFYPVKVYPKPPAPRLRLISCCKRPVRYTGFMPTTPAWRPNRTSNLGPCNVHLSYRRYIRSRDNAPRKPVHLGYILAQGGQGPQHPCHILHTLSATHRHLDLTYRTVTIS